MSKSGRQTARAKRKILKLEDGLDDLRDTLEGMRDTVIPEHQKNVEEALSRVNSSMKNLHNTLYEAAQSSSDGDVVIQSGGGDK